MKTLFVLFSLILLSATASAQRLSQLHFQSGGSFSFFTILTEQDVHIRISDEGKILEWGSEILSDYGHYYAPQLQPFMGRVEYFGREADSTAQGKIKSIGSTFLTYYGPYEEAHKRGKLRTMGMLFFDYFSNYDEKSLQGKLKMIGNLALDYYRSYENESYRGKLKAIGNLPITYYSVFDDRFNAGKLKSVGPANYTWYSQFDQARGGLKTNSYRQVVGGITVVLR
jgi:hypothetical protein